MRQGLAIGLAAAALGLAACGGDDVGGVAGDAAEQVEALTGLSPSELAERTRQVTDEVTSLGRRLAEDANVDVDQQLADAEQEARTLADEAEKLAEEQPDVGRALQTANEQLAETARALQDAADPDAVRDALGGPAAEAQKALEEAVGDTSQLEQDARDQLEGARDQLQELEDQVPSLGG